MTQLYHCPPVMHIPQKATPFCHNSSKIQFLQVGCARLFFNCFLEKQSSVLKTPQRLQFLTSAFDCGRARCSAHARHVASALLSNCSGEKFALIVFCTYSSVSLLNLWVKSTFRFFSACIGASIPEQSVPIVNGLSLKFTTCLC